MIKDIRYIIKRVIIGVAIALILFYGKGLMAHAEVFNTTLKIDNVIVKANNWKSVGGTYGYYRVEYDGYPEGITGPSDYWYGSLVVCRDNASSGVDWNPSGAYSASTQLSVNNTSMPCFYPNSNYDGGKITIVNWKTSGGGSYNPVGFNLYQTGTSSVALLGIYINAQNWVDPNDFAGISSYAKQLEISNKITNIYNSIGYMTTSITDAISMTNQIAEEDFETEGSDRDTKAIEEWLDDFSSDTYGLTSIITAPLNTISSLTSSTCSALHVPIPFMNNEYMELPCMSNIYSNTFGSAFTLYQTVTTALIGYWCVVRIFAIVKGMKDPNDDKIEVVDL